MHLDLDLHTYFPLSWAQSELATALHVPMSPRFFLAYNPAAGPALAIGNVDPEGPMAAAGITKGDRIMSVDGHEIHELARPVAAKVLKEALESSATNLLTLVVARRCPPDVRTQFALAVKYSTCTLTVCRGLGDGSAFRRAPPFCTRMAPTTAIVNLPETLVLFQIMAATKHPQSLHNRSG